MKKIKPVIQSSLKDCGVACMQWIIMYYDGYIPLEKLREDTCTTELGTSAYNIVEAFKKWNFDAVGVLEKDLDSPELMFPLIAHLRLKNGLEHFVVVKKVVKNVVYLMDPGSGNKKMSITEFKELFTGYIILSYPREELIKLEKDLTISKLFKNIVNKEKFLIIKIIITSILWSLLSILSSYYLKIGTNIIGQSIKLINLISFAFLIVIVLKCLFVFIREYYKNYLNNLVDVYLYPRFLKHLFYLPLKNISSRTSGELITRIEELANLKVLFSDIFISCFLDSIMMLTSLVILFLISKKLCLFLVLFIILYGILGIIISKVFYNKALKSIDYQTNFNSVILESIEMCESVKHLNIIKSILKKIEFSLSKYLLCNFELNNFVNNTNLMKNLLIEISLFIINYMGIMQIVNNNLSMIDLVTFNLILTYCVDPLQNLINLLPKYNYITASFSKIMEFINIKEEVLEENDELLDGDIVLKNVSYSYNNYNYVLDNVNLVIKKNSHVLLNGPSGCGKSTVCKLIYGEYSCNKGNILIGNKNIKDLELYTIRNNILYVSQKEKLFFGTIKENILAGREVSNELLDKVCKICKIEEIVSKKSMRYNSVIEPALSNLSGGEKQRIILARGLLKSASILILDEALSEVDKKTEVDIIKNIRKFYSDKTIIYISHKNQSSSFEQIINIGDKYELLQN